MELVWRRKLGLNSQHFSSTTAPASLFKARHGGDDDDDRDDDGLVDNYKYASLI